VRAIAIVMLALAAACAPPTPPPARPDPAALVGTLPVAERRDEDDDDSTRARAEAELSAEEVHGPRAPGDWRTVEVELPPCPPEAARADPVPIPAGPFVAGCDDRDVRRCGRGEGPRREVTLATFALDRTEVTQAAWERCVDAGACTPPAGVFEPRAWCRHPVVGVTWAQADGYCRWVGGRLPTELEWEKAARGDDARTHPWGDAPPTCERASFADCGGEVAAVGATPAGASPFGVLDLAGNVREWVADAGPAGHPTRGIRGGASHDDAADLRITRRAFGDVAVTDGGLGFRCAR
jgi:formylglycine-generating enzyme required for sulfatase activity